MSETTPLVTETVYHIFNHANGSEDLFRSNENYRYFLEKYLIYIHPVAETYAYCLMPNHFHLMIKVRNKQEVIEFLQLCKPGLKGFHTDDGFSDKEISYQVSQQFSNFFNAYCKAYNNMYKRKGSLFMPRFKRKPVGSDEYFTQLIAYIHLNPVKHGFCKHILDWQHSSIHAYYQEKNTKLNRKYLQQWFGNREKLIAFHNSLEIEDSLFDF